jgi:hypothetical protein
MHRISEASVKKESGWGRKMKEIREDSSEKCLELN